jgi:UDP-3-O-[3-hydroxymyristoyl] glucosamine N-acyltransferase
VVLGGQVGVPGHLTIGRGAIAVAQTGVTNSIAPGVMVGGYPSLEVHEWRRTQVLVRRLPELKKRIEQLEARVAELMGQTSKSESSLE